MIRSFYVLLILLLFPLTVLAESPPVDQSEPQAPSERTFMDQTHRREIYDLEKKDTMAAVGYSLLFPGLGNFYAEQYFVGALAMSLMGFALVFAGYALATDQPQFYVWSGVTAAVAYGGAISTSIVGVSDYNENLRDRLNLQTRTGSGPAISIRLRF